MKTVAIYAVIHTDAISSGGENNSPHFTYADAVAAGGQLARDLYPTYSGGVTLPDDESDSDAIDMLRNFEDVNIEIEQVNLDEAFIRALYARLNESGE